MADMTVFQYDERENSCDGTTNTGKGRTRKKGKLFFAVVGFAGSIILLAVVSVGAVCVNGKCGDHSDTSSYSRSNGEDVISPVTITRNGDTHHSFDGDSETIMARRTGEDSNNQQQPASKALSFTLPLSITTTTTNYTYSNISYANMTANTTTTNSTDFTNRTTAADSTTNLTSSPTSSPSSLPPTSIPTISPTAAPTLPPTVAPTLPPTPDPTLSPTIPPSTMPPTFSPTTSPTWFPTWSPPTAPPTTSPLQDNTMRILPLGDSITMNGFDHFSYRYYLWRLLILQLGANNVDFVGTLRDSAYGNNPVWPPVVASNTDTGGSMEYAFDQDHEGHWGWATGPIIDQLDGWLDSYAAPPTIALVHLGTNNCIEGEAPNDIYQAILRVVEILHAKHPGMQVFVATLISTTQPDVQACVNSLNGILKSSLPTTLTGGPKHLVDMADGFDAERDLWDSLHPTSAASEKMANKWYDAIMVFAGANN